MVFGFRKKSSSAQATAVEEVSHDIPLDQAQPQRTSLLPVFACGAGLFSDGYVNNVIGSVSTVLSYVSLARSSSHSSHCEARFEAQVHLHSTTSNTILSIPSPQPSTTLRLLPLPAQSLASSSLVIWQINGRASTPFSSPPLSSSFSPPLLLLLTGMARQWVCCLSSSPGMIKSPSQ